MRHEDNYTVRGDMCLTPLAEELSKAYGKRIKAIEKAVFLYEFPDADGDGEISAADASYILEFASSAGAGMYTNDKAGWATFAQERGINPDIFPDVDKDGMVTAEDVSYIREFSSQAGSGLYDNDAYGWELYMESIFGKPDRGGFDIMKTVGSLEVLE